MITQLNPRRKPKRWRQVVHTIERLVIITAAVFIGNLIGCNNLTLAPRSIVTVADVTGGRVEWTSLTAATRQAPKVTLALSPGSSPVSYYQGEAQYYLPSSDLAQLPVIKFAFSQYLAFPDTSGGIGVATQPVTKEVTLDGLITREVVDFSSRQTKAPETYDLNALVTLTGENIHGDKIQTKFRVPVVFTYSN